MRAGAALPVVLFVLSLTSALAVSGAFVTRQLGVVASAAQRGAELQPFAERALVDAVAEWDSLARTAQSVGTVAALPASGSLAIQTDAWVTRLGERTYWLVAESRGDTRPPLRRRIGLLIRVSNGVPALVPERAWSEVP